MGTPKYRRVLLKVSGEALMGDQPYGIDVGTVDRIATDIEERADGTFTGKPRGTPTFREGKIVAVNAWLASKNLRLADCESWFFSDSLNDLPLLELVTHPVAVDPDPTLRARAQERGWRIMSLR